MKISLVSFKKKVTFTTSSATDNSAIITPSGGRTLHDIKVLLHLKSSGNIHLFISGSTVCRSTAELNHSTTARACSGI